MSILLAQNDRICFSYGMLNCATSGNGLCIIEPKVSAGYESGVASQQQLAYALEYLIHVCVEGPDYEGGVVMNIGM